MTVQTASTISDLLVSPFQRLNQLLAGLDPGRPAINLSVGEPKHAFPALVQPALLAALDGFGRYPPMKGTDDFRAAAASWLTRRYGLKHPIDPETEVLPLNGSREGLFFAAVQARLLTKKTRPAILLPNPFYQAYAAGTAAADCEPVLLAGPQGLEVDPDTLDPALLDRTIALYWASPANPQGTVTSLATWEKLIALARRHDFLLLADECYSEIYRATPVPGVLQACERLGGGLDRVVAFNSLSKRSNLPGLRAGFAAGDPAFLAKWLTFRNMAAPQVPSPLQAVAAAALRDEAHVEANRQAYNAKFASAEAILKPLFGPTTPDGGFCLWLDASRFGDDVTLVRRLWAEAGVRALPGSYLAGAMTDGTNPGAGFVRLALVDTVDQTDAALRRFVDLLQQGI